MKARFWLMLAPPPACWTGTDCTDSSVSVFRLYNNNITDVGAKLVAHIVEECPKLAVLK